MGGNHIARTMTIDGLVTPAFIHNGRHFFTSLEVYADGLVNCWELLDLALFEDRLRSGWVRTSVPDGQEVHVHGLGSWRITNGRWVVDVDGMLARVKELVRTLNPRFENLHDCHGRTEEMCDGMRTSILALPSEQPIRWAKENGFSVRVEGQNVSVLVAQDGEWFVADLRAFADGVIELGRLPRVETFDLAGLAVAVDEGRIASALPVGTRVAIYELGTFEIAEEVWTTEVADIVRGVPDLIEAANGRPDSVQRCRATYEAYLANPTEEARARLREAYEAVPAHNRMYVGDMDVKDIAVRMVIYGDEEIEGWTHRIVARAAGGPLPTITVPKPEPKP